MSPHYEPYDRDHMNLLRKPCGVQGICLDYINADNSERSSFFFLFYWVFCCCWVVFGDKILIGSSGDLEFTMCSKLTLNL